VRAEIVGPRILAPEDVRTVEERTEKAIGESVELAVRARTDVLVTATQYRAVGDARFTENRDDPSAPDPGLP
jgi:hypothetical protein